MYKRSKVKVEGNQKVRGATKCVYNDIKFDSKLELYFYKALQAADIKFEFKPKYVLQDKFKYNIEPVREITYSPDFFIPQLNMIIDTKGWATDMFKMKLKMLKYKLQSIGSHYLIELPKNQKECNELIEAIKNNQVTN